MRINLQLGGEIIPLYFGMVAFEEMQKLVSSYLGANKYATDVIWSGYLNQCAILMEHPELTYADFAVKLEEVFFSEETVNSNIQDVLKAFESSKAGSRLFKEVDKALEVIESVKDDLSDDAGTKKKNKKAPSKK